MLKSLLKKYNSLKFKVSPLLVVYAIVFIVLGYTYEGFSYIIAVVIHEFAHADEAKRRGYTLKSMSFTVFGAALKIDDRAMKNEDERMIAIAGPAVNFFIGVFCVALWWTFPSTYFFTMDFAWANFSVFAFNLLPVYPLDGGRVVLSLLSQNKPRSQAVKPLRIIGYILALILLTSFALSLYFGLFNPSFLLVGIFVALSTLFPDNSCAYCRLYTSAYRSERIKRTLPLREIAVFPDLSLKDAYRKLSTEFYTCFVIMDERLRPTTVIPESAVESNLDKASDFHDLISILSEEEKNKRENLAKTA